MFIIALNRNKLKMIKYILWVTVILLIIFFIYSMFSRSHSTFNLDNESFVQYTNDDDSFSFMYPCDWEIEEEQFYKEDILYNINFYEDSGKAYGLVQVWDTTQDIESMVSNVEKNSLKGVIDLVEKKSIKINNHNGYSIQYVTKKEDLEDCYRAKEIFLENEGRIFRFGLSARDSDWNRTHDKMFTRISKSIRFS